MSIKSQIVARLQEIVKPLLAESKFRAIARATAPAITAPIKPAIHLVIGDERRIEEDTRGYTMEFPVMYDLIVEDARDPYALADASVAFVQEKVESDIQLGGLCNALIYDGELPYTNDINRPFGGTLVMYLIQYRRPRANPNALY
jgi:hypothetical protein